MIINLNIKLNGEYLCNHPGVDGISPLCSICLCPKKCTQPSPAVSLLMANNWMVGTTQTNPWSVTGLGDGKQDLIGIYSTVCQPWSIIWVAYTSGSAHEND